MINYKSKANKLVKKFANEMKLDRDTAKMLVAKYLFDTMQGINESDFIDDEKKALFYYYYNMLKALSNETIIESN